MTPDRGTLVAPGLVAPLVVLALVCEVLAWLSATLPGVLGPGYWLGRGELLATVHLATVGTLGAAIVGTGWQLVPVVTARAPGAAWSRVAGVVNLGFALGLVGLIVGFWHPGPWLLGGSLVLVAALLLRAGAVVWALVRTSGRIVQRGWLIAAELCLVVGLGLAAVLAAERTGIAAPVFDDRIAGIGLHAALMLGGWVGGWMIGLGSMLLPMFAVAPEPSHRALALAGLLWFGGLLAQQPLIWALGAVLGGGLVLSSLSRRVKRRAGVGILGAALALVALAALGPAMITSVPPALIVTGALLLWALPFLRGVALRIVPFLTWVHTLGDLGPGAPPVETLVPGPLARLAVVAGVLAGVLVLGAGALEQWTLARLGAGLGALGALATLALVLITAVRGTLARNRADALPGMESP